MDNTNLEIVKKEIENECNVCRGTGYSNHSHCKTCDGLGVYRTYIYYFIKDGICFSGDTLK